MVKRKIDKRSSDNIPKKGQCTKMGGRAKSGEEEGRIRRVVDDIIKSPTDDQRFYRYLELENGIKTVLISDLENCDLSFSDESESDEASPDAPGCLSPDIQQFNQEVLGLGKRRPCCRCKDHHRQAFKNRMRKLIRERDDFEVNCKTCTGVGPTFNDNRL